jgi:hypothetical protein
MSSRAALVLAIGVCLTASRVHAQSAGENGVSPESPASGGPPLEWDAPPGCPGRDDVLSHVAALVQKDDVRWARFERIRARVTRDGRRWSLRLQFIGADASGEREIRSGRCDELAEAAAVAIVLAHRSDTPTEGGWSQTPAGDAAGPAAGSPEEPAPAQAVSETPAEPRAPALEPEAVSLAIGAEALLDPATLGSVAFGAGAGLELRFGALSGGLYAAAFPAVETALGNGQAVALGLWTGGARGCLRWGRSLDTCAHFELGQLSAEGVGLVQASEGRDPWLAPGLSAAFTSSPFDGFGVTTRVSLYHPLVRGRYRVDESELVHQIPALTFRVALGVSIPLL